MRGFGVVLIGLAVFRAFKGQFRSEDNAGGMQTLDRSRSPVRFWGQLALQVAIGLVLVLAPINI
jgi:hypothetical protein